jgi:flagellar biosynthesis/type III secretory pathway chaperone
MNDYFTYLIELLDKEMATFRLMLAALEAEQKALIDNDVTGLGETVETQKALVQRAATQEQARVKIIQQMAPMLQEDPKTLTLRRLIELADASFAERLSAQREELLNYQDRLRQTNRQNSVLIKQSMKYVDKSLLILTGGSPMGNRYGKSGKADASQASLQGVVNQVA